MNIIFSNSDKTNVCALLKKLDKCIIKDDYRSLTNVYSNDWLPQNERRILEWANTNYNLSVNYSENYDYGVRAAFKRVIRKIVHKLIKFNLMSICLHQTELNAQLVRIQNHQYHLLGIMSFELKELQRENSKLKENLEHYINNRGEN